MTAKKLIEVMIKRAIVLLVEKAKELGYWPNNFANNLRKNNTHTIGVLMHELNSTFMLSVLTGIEKVIAQTDYDIFNCSLC